jgi:hypothetical protein
VSCIHTIGSTKLWFPSRKSVESHLGGLSMVLEGHCRPGRLRGLKGLYFVEGSLSLVVKESAVRTGALVKIFVSYMGILNGGVVAIGGFAFFPGI